jgi:ribonucleoside-diphosphate reductase alpha chain
MAGVRTLVKQFSSCVLVDIDDSLDSIFASASAIGHYSAKRAGIGVNIGRIRAINSPIRGGEVVHTGIVPYLKVIESVVKSTQQNGIRGASGTVYCPWWHYEIDDVIVLKNNAGTDDNRVRKLDYSIQFCGLFYKRLINKEDVTLFCPNEARGLYDTFGTDKFEELYLKYEQDKNITRKKSVPAFKLAALFARERLETGRIYAMNVDNCNNHGSWNIPVRMSNLCNEVITPTLPQISLEDPDAEIGICTLSAVNITEIKNDEEHESVCDIIVRLLDALLDYQNYPVKAGENFSINRRSLGVSITNLAAYLAKNKTLYSDVAAVELVDEFMEKQQYFLLKASNNLAKEVGSCTKYNDTKYSKGLLPIDWCNDGAKKLTNRKLSMDWEGLRAAIKEYGLRNSTLSCQAPIESSSVIQNSTNGVEPLRSLLMQKKSKMGVLKQLPPFYPKYKNYYQLAYSIGDNKSINNIVGTICKWVDMATSTNHWYNYDNYENGIIPLSVVIKDMIDAYNKGVKTLYYANTDDGDKDSSMGCEGGACSV